MVVYNSVSQTDPDTQRIIAYPKGGGVYLPSRIGTHTPLNYRDYLRSPQRSMWRTAMELKYDEYRALNMFALEVESEVRAAGHSIMDTLWGI